MKQYQQKFTVNILSYSLFYNEETIHPMSVFSWVLFICQSLLTFHLLFRLQKGKRY